MQPLRLDFERKSRRAVWVGWAVLLAGIASAAAAGHAFVLAGEQKADAETTLARLQRKGVPAARGASGERDARQYTDAVKRANAIAERLTLPWQDVFAAVHAVATKEVALLALEPDAQKGSVRITAESRNKADMLAYVGRLSRDERLANVHLVSHHVQAQAVGQPVRFSLQASWSVKRAER